MTVKQLIEALQKFHPDAKCWAYEGEVSGVAIDEHGDTPGGFVHNDGTVKVRRLTRRGGSGRGDS